MKNTLTIVMFLIAIESLGQQCEKKTDPFSNETFTAYEWKSGGFQTIYLELRNDTVRLSFRAVEVVPIKYKIPKGAEILIKLESGEIIRLETSHETLSVPYIAVPEVDGNDIVFSAYYPKANLSRDQLTLLAKSKVTHLHCPDLYGGIKRFNDKELRNKWQQYLMEGAQCMLRSN